MTRASFDLLAAHVLSHDGMIRTCSTGEQQMCPEFPSTLSSRMAHRGLCTRATRHLRSHTLQRAAHTQSNDLQHQLVLHQNRNAWALEAVRRNKLTNADCATERRSRKACPPIGRATGQHDEKIPELSVHVLVHKCTWLPRARVRCQLSFFPSFCRFGGQPLIHKSAACSSSLTYSRHL